MAERAYWSSRMGRGPLGDPTIYDLHHSVQMLGRELWQRDYLQEWYGYECVDAGTVLGRSAMELSEHIETVLGYRDAWPVPDDPFNRDPELHVEPDDEEIRRAEDRIFDIIEFLYDHVSEGVEEPSAFHSYGGCGWHFKSFDPQPARDLVRVRMNAVLNNYGEGYEINGTGEIVHSAPAGLLSLMQTPLRSTERDIQDRVNAAISTYRSRARTVETQRDAVRNLFDVLEKLRPHIKEEMLEGDESDLFKIANTVSVRHLNANQRGAYDGPLWLSWLFYVNLSTVHLMTRIIERKAGKTR
jgi:hypothetical protein